MLDLTRYTYEELLKLNSDIIDRLNYLEERQDQKAMLSFQMGERVSFESKFGLVFGIIVKFNKKTVVVSGDEGKRWKVSPVYLRKVKTVHSNEKLSLVEPPLT